MTERFYPHIIVGGGLAGAAAVDGIRQLDAAGSILLIYPERILQRQPEHLPAVPAGKPS